MDPRSKRANERIKLSFLNSLINEQIEIGNDRHWKIDGEKLKAVLWAKSDPSDTLSIMEARKIIREWGMTTKLHGHANKGLGYILEKF
jgi:hypothetical protein